MSRSPLDTSRDSALSGDDSDRRAGLAALCQFRGMLVLFAIQPAVDGKGHCPDCGCATFRDGPHGWLECENDCGFSVLKKHVEDTRVNQ
jgi:hypothetical protein